MSVFAFGLLALVLLVVLTAAVGGVLDLPSLAAFRATLADRRVKVWAILVAVSPILSAMADLPAKVAAAGKLPEGPTTALTLAGGAFFTAALAGCWLAMDEADDPHSRPNRDRTSRRSARAECLSPAPARPLVSWWMLAN